MSVQEEWEEIIKQRRQRALEKYGDYPTPGHKVLDIGVGESPHKDATDAIDVTSRDLMFWPLKNLAQTHFVRDSATNLPYKADTFDKVYATRVFKKEKKYVDPLRGVTEAYRVLRPGGKLVITSWKKDIPEVIDFLESHKARYSVRYDKRDPWGKDQLVLIAFKPLRQVIDE